MSRRRVGTGFVGLAALAVLAATLAPGSAAAAKNRKHVEGTVYDTTCVIACPLAVTPSPPPVCVRAEGCPRFGVYRGEGAVVNVRHRGSAKVLARLAVVAGYFKLWLGPGEYVLHPYLPEEPCWSGVPARLRVRARQKSPVPASVYVRDSCVAHPDATR